jgi:hypothetical protein
MKDDLFDPVFRMALLEDCERFSRENDATLEVHQGVPILELNGRRVIVHMTAFVSADLQLFHNSSDGSNLVVDLLLPERVPVRTS